MLEQQFLLMKLAEEAAELAKIALKTAQYGFSSRHPDGGPTNLEACHAELNDVLGIVDVLNQLGFGFEQDTDAVKEKAVKIQRFRYAISPEDFERDVEITYTGLDGLDHTEHAKYSSLPQRLVFLEQRGAQMLSWSFA